MTLEKLPSPVQRRLPELEALRGLLALWVLGYHFLEIFGQWDHVPTKVKELADGANAVDVFILLSGFVITGLLLSVRESYFAFLFRRYWRLMPVFMICLSAALVAQSLGYMPVGYTSGDFLPLLTANLVLMHGAIPNEWIPGASGAMLNPAWSISLEWQFYLLAPLLVALLARGGLSFIAGSAFCIVIFRLLLPNLVGFDGAFLPSKIQLFWIGIISYLAYRFFASDDAYRAPGQAVALALLAASVLLLPYKQNVGLIIWLFVMVMLAGRWQVVWRIFRLKPVVRLGAISYPLYLSHEVVIWLLLALWSPSSAGELVLSFIFVLTLTVGLSWAIHVAVEAPANKFAKGLFLPVNERKNRDILKN